MIRPGDIVMTCGLSKRTRVWDNVDRPKECAFLDGKVGLVIRWHEKYSQLQILTGCGFIGWVQEVDVTTLSAKEGRRSVHQT